ncbi:MAG: FAD-dependent oxidoreductase [Rubrivivax sp.]
MRRRAFLSTLALAGCSKPAAPAFDGGWVGAAHERGHRLREPPAWPSRFVERRAAVVIVGAGVAGLAAARSFARRGVDDVQLLELEDQCGGNSRGHVLAGQPCPLGAHYLPVPGAAAREVSEWLFELGLLRHEMGRTVADERHLCHAPQERLFVDGAWAEGLLPPADPASLTMAEYRRFAAKVAEAQALGFAIPTTRAPWTAAHAALDALAFDAWLQREGFADARLRWYLDYCCRDDYGAGLGTVSAWAGLHYFASRHGFHAPGDEAAEREPVFTWPEGNAWLVAKLAAPFADRLHAGRTVLRVREERQGAEVLAWDEHGSRAERWTAGRVVLALPPFVAARLMENPPQALRAAAAQPQAPWLVANLHLAAPLLDRTGAPPSWDNVPFGAAGLGYVDAGHQRLNPAPGPVVLTAYHALPATERAALLAQDWRAWAGRVVDDLAGVHPDLRAKLARADLMRYGHAMAVPAPGWRGHAALAALREGRGRVRFAHAGLAGYSVFEEAFTQGHAAGLE